MRWFAVNERGNQIRADDRLEMLKCKCVMSSCRRYTVAEYGLRGAADCHYTAWRLEKTAAHPYGLQLGNYSNSDDAKARCEQDSFDYAQAS